MNRCLKIGFGADAQEFSALRVGDPLDHGQQAGRFETDFSLQVVDIDGDDCFDEDSFWNHATACKLAWKDFWYGEADDAGYALKDLVAFYRESGFEDSAIPYKICLFASGQSCESGANNGRQAGCA